MHARTPPIGSSEQKEPSTRRERGILSLRRRPDEEYPFIIFTLFLFIYAKGFGQENIVEELFTGPKPRNIGAPKGWDWTTSPP